MLTETPLWPEPPAQRSPSSTRRRRGSAQRARRARRKRSTIGILALVAVVVAAAGSAYTLGLLEPEPTAETTVPASAVVDVQAAAARSATVSEDLAGGVKSAQAVLKSPDGLAAGQAERQTLSSAIVDAQQVVTSLESVAWPPSGSDERATALVEQATTLQSDARAATTALHEATEAVVASGQKARQERAAVLAEAADASAQAEAEADAVDTDVSADEASAGETASAGDTEPATGTTKTETAAGSCPEPDQVWSAENGHLASSELAPIPFAAAHSVRADVVGGLAELNAAYSAEFGVNLTINSSYRTYASQESLYDPSSKTAAPPGCSNHGTGLAIDIGGGVQAFGSAQYEWLKANAESYGWVHPPFAEPSGRNPEPWHWQSVQAPNSY